MNPGLFLSVTALLYMFSTALQMGTNAARLAGVRTKRVATGLTLFNLFATTGRFLSLFYMPLIGSLADKSERLQDPNIFRDDMRFVMAASTVGILLGGALVPWATRLLERGIVSFERRHSLLRAVGAAVEAAGGALRSARLPSAAVLDAAL